MKVQSNLDLVGHQLINVIFEKLAVAPTGTESRVYYNTITKTPMYHNGTSWIPWSSITSQDVINAIGYTPLNANLKGSPLGVAELGADGFVLNTQLPAYVDEIINVTTYVTLPTIGEVNKIYIANDTNITYRWSGSTYVIISDTIALGTTSATAYRGDFGQAAYTGRISSFTTIGTGVATFIGNILNIPTVPIVTGFPGFGIVTGKVWGFDSHPTTIADYGITDAAASGIPYTITNGYIPKFDGVGLVDTMMYADTYGINITGSLITTASITSPEYYRTDNYTMWHAGNSGTSSYDWLCRYMVCDYLTVNVDITTTGNITATQFYGTSSKTKKHNIVDLDINAISYVNL